MEWQPIERAPIKAFDKEKWFIPATPWLLLTDGRGVFMGQYSYTEKGKGRWRTHLGTCSPTQWQHLPEPPK